MEQSKIALLIDAENISTKYLDAIMNEIAKTGKLVISRYYGDIQKLGDDWNKKAIDFAIKPVHQPNVAVRKNAADMAMALDAMEIMYIGKVDTFFIVSSDSDFTPLASKLKEGGMRVVGIGDQNKVTNAFKSSCNEFKYFNYILDSDEDEIESKDVQKTTKNNDDNGISKAIKEIILENGENNKLHLSRVGDILLNRFSDFDTRKYGAKQLSALVDTIDGLKLTKENTTYYIELTESNTKEEIYNIIVTIISKNTSKRMKYAKLMEEIKKLIPNFSYKEYGYTKFRKFLSSFEKLSTTNNFVKIKDE